ncbi:tetratricopeptide repeat protein 19, mitochondrial-like [Diabrotica undecimpunctata]|uniref:tetratricopeptide repeat protein 19, mitochondrial-like n=1 Tax=Diabrotica undecimpunctata TaxID=50387 RepID=UPI003B642211
MFSAFKNFKLLLPLSFCVRTNIQTFYKYIYHPRLVGRCTPFVALIPSLNTKPLSTSITSSDVEENIGELLNLVKHALDKGELDKAEAILDMGIKICEEYQSYFSLPYMYDVLASIAFATGKIGKAENILVKAIEKMVQLNIGEDNEQMIDFKLRLARIYSLYREDVLAEIGFGTCLRDQERKIINGDFSTRTGMLYINCLFFYGLHKIGMSEHKTARQLIDSAYNYAMKLKGLSPYQEMMILGTLAELNTELEEYELALQNVNSAIILGKGIGSFNLPKLYLKLAKIYIKLDSEILAEHWLREANNLAELFSDKRVVEETKLLLQDIESRKY